MRTTSTIWETASRPLFVRSIWLEASNEGRTLRRHFILDYEPKERERMRTATTAGTSPTRNRRASLRQSNSYDEYEHARYKLNESFDDDDQDTCILLDATKLKLQQQQQQQQHQQTQSSARHCLKASRSTRRRSWLHASRKSATCYSQACRDLYSRRSSLQDLQTSQALNGPNPEERLAERVLNWLDLAGKTDILRTQSREPSTMGKDSNSPAATATTTTTTTAATRHQRRCVRTRAESRNEQTPTKRAFKRVPTVNAHATQRISALAQRRTTTSSKHLQQQQQQMQAPICQHNRPDSVKPITIIFNKEGIPVRLNRPARNIDLCALSSSSSTTRRLAGRLASARLYAASPHSAAGRDDTTHKLTPPHSNRSQHEANKKQLHIFMPSLPKKGLLMSMGSSCGGESVSGIGSAIGIGYPGVECDLNQTFSELCHI